MSLLRVILREEKGCWVAQGLELDICTQANSRDECKRRFFMTLDAEEAMHTAPESQIGTAPVEFFEEWDETDDNHRFYVKY